MKITQEILAAAIRKIGKIQELDAREIETMVKTILVGEEARNHTVSHCLAYFSSEETILPSCYHDMPAFHCDFFEKVSNELPHDAYVEHINSVEHAIYW
jgi:hypothetical protein